jgi:transposase-like protein
MEHRKFNKLLKELDELTEAQARKVLDTLGHQGDGDEVTKLIEERLTDDPQCPRCGATHLQRYGKEHGLQRYRCVGCGRTFNALTGTPLARLRHKDRWLTFARSLKLSHSVREAARLAGVGKNTSFRWRHRFLQLDKGRQKQKLTGIVEIDESFILESRKGERGLPRAPRKRGGKAKKPGLSDEQTPVLIARDRHGDEVDAVLPERTAKAVEAALEGVLVKEDVLLCIDGDPALATFAENNGFEYELIIASRGERMHEKVLHIQNVNAKVSRFKKWLERFNGVASKYLSSYLTWQRELENGKTPFAAALC